MGDESDLYVPTSDRSCLFSLGSGGVSYGLKALVNLCLGMLKLMKGKYVQLIKKARRKSSQQISN